MADNEVMGGARIPTQTWLRRREVARDIGGDGLEPVAAQELLSVLMAHIPDLVVRFDRELRHLYVSPGIERITGIPARDFVGRTNRELGQPEDLCALWDRELLPIFETGRARTFEFLYPTDAAPLCFEATAVPEVGADGTVVSIVSISRDLTERKREEAERQVSEALFRSAFDNAPLGALLVGPDRKVVRANSAFAELLGYDGEELAGRTVAELTHPDDVDVSARALEPLRDGLRDGTLLEKRYLRRDGTGVYVIVGITAVRDDAGALVAYMGQVQDLSEREQLRAELHQAQKLEALGSLAGGITHDFNNLLTVINGYSDLALAELKPGSAAALSIAEVRRAADRAANLTRQLLAFSRKQAIETRIVDVREIVEGYSDMLKRLIGERVTVTSDLATCPLPVNGDADQLGQVLLNLAINARDAMPDGGELRLTTGRCNVNGESPSLELAPGPYARLSVADTGGGIDPVHLGRIFDPFFTTKPAGEGTGLGLSVAHGIVHQHGGTITVRSTIGEGTEFSVYLPLASAPATAGESGPSEHRMDGKVVVLVDDDDIVRELVSRQLEARGYTTLPVAGAQAALALGDALDDAVVLITDVTMPGMSGPELAYALRQSNPELRIVYTSGYSVNAVAERPDWVEADGFLQKPFTIDQLDRTIRNVLARPPVPR